MSSANAGSMSEESCPVRSAEFPAGLLHREAKVGRLNVGSRGRADNATVGTKKPIPEEIEHREIAVPMAVVDEMELLLSSEPGKAAKP